MQHVVPITRACRRANPLGSSSTPSFDKMGPVGEDPRWEVFGPFHDYLLKAFPLV